VGKFISLFAGVGGFDLGMELAGHECVAQVEWDKNAAGVLKRRWPDVPLFCDVSRVSGEDLPDCDFLTYGFPCQDLSVAGKREGLSGERSGLFFEATRLIRELHARGSGIRFALAENVAGLFSADDGRAFARCIGELLESGASEIGWRMFDSQYFGVPQRRKRVFIVADFGGRSCDEIFAITESLPGYPAPSRESGEGIAGDVEAGFTASSFGGYERGCGTLRSQGGDLGGGSETLLTQGADVYNRELTGEVACTLTAEGAGDPTRSGPKAISWNGDVTPKASEDVSVTLRSQQGGEGVGVAFQKSELRLKDKIELNEVSPTLNAETKQGDTEVNVVKENLTVRRLTPKECERLQGFPDEWTIERMELELVDNEWKPTGKVIKQTDGPRYKQMGNAVTVNVAYWLGKRMRKVIDE
jgi:DNA (cytosine-5)-methyltransferase 1